MKKFEYLSIEVYYHSIKDLALYYNSRQKGESASLAHSIDNLGEDGWELVTILERPSHTLIAVFKRETREKNGEGKVEYLPSPWV